MALNVHKFVKTQRARIQLGGSGCRRILLVGTNGQSSAGEREGVQANAAPQVNDRTDTCLGEAVGPQGCHLRAGRLLGAVRGQHQLVHDVPPAFPSSRAKARLGEQRADQLRRVVLAAELLGQREGGLRVVRRQGGQQATGFGGVQGPDLGEIHRVILAVPLLGRTVTGWHSG